MSKLYLNDPDGRKEATLSDTIVNSPEELFSFSADLACQQLVHSDASRLFFAQNLTTHLAQILSLIRTKNPDISKVYMSDHEMDWIKKMIETPNYQPDATYSNYGNNDAISCPTFNVEVLPFDTFEKEIVETKEASVFYVSHVSRLTGEIADIVSIFQIIKKNNPNSLLIIDGSQSIGAIGKVEIENHCDVYLGVSSKFIGAEPHLGLAFMSESFYTNYIQERNNYPSFDAEDHAKDILSLWNSLQNPLYESDFSAYIKGLKHYAVQKLSFLGDQVVYNPINQAPHFLTLNFGSVEKNKQFVDFAEQADIIISENSGWSISESATPLVRIALSIRVTEQDIDAVVEAVDEYIKKEATRN